MKTGSFGKFTVGANNLLYGGNYNWGTQFTLPEAGSLIKISYYTSSEGGVWSNAAVYQYAPGSKLMGVSEIRAVPAATGWIDRYFTNWVGLPAGSYILCTNSTWSNLLYFDTASNRGLYEADTFPTSDAYFPHTFQDTLFSINGEYYLESESFSESPTDSVSISDSFSIIARTISRITENVSTLESTEFNVAIDDYKFVTKINGIEIIPKTCDVVKTLGGTNASSKFYLELENYNGRASTDFNIGDEIIIYYDKFYYPKQKIFTGIIEEISLSGKEQKETLILSGRDYSARLIDRVVEPEIYNNQLAGDIVQDIVNKYTDNITINNVFNGELVDRIVFKQISVFDAIKKLAEQSGYIFYVDEDKDLHFEEQSTVSSGHTFNSTNILKTSFREKRDTLYNEIWVYGDRYLDSYQETFKAGSPVGGSIFTLGYKPHNTSVTVSGGVIQPGGIYNQSYSPGSNTKYLVNYDDMQIIFTSGVNLGYNIPASGNSVVIDYYRDLPVVKVGDNSASVEAYGKRVKVVQDSSIKDPLAAEAVLFSELEAYSDPIKEGKLDLKGIYTLTPGHTCIVDIPLYGINNVVYDIAEVRYTFNKKTEQAKNHLSVLINKKIPDVTDTLKDILLQLKAIQSKDIDSSDIITRYKVSTGSLGIRHSGLYIYESNVTGSGYHLYGTNFIPPINPFYLASGTNQSYLAGSFTGSASIFGPFTIVWSGGFF